MQCTHTLVAEDHIIHIVTMWSCINPCTLVFFWCGEDIFIYTPSGPDTCLHKDLCSDGSLLHSDRDGSGRPTRSCSGSPYNILEKSTPRLLKSIAWLTCIAYIHIYIYTASFGCALDFAPARSWPQIRKVQADWLPECTATRIVRHPRSSPV